MIFNAHLRAGLSAAFVGLSLAASAQNGCDSTFIFDASLGGPWGPAHGTAPGDVIFNLAGAEVEAVELDWGAAGTGFSASYLEAAPVGATGWGTDQVMRYDNMAHRFKFMEAGVDVTFMQIGFLDLGGEENLMINGLTGSGGAFVDLASNHGQTIDGVYISVSTTPVTGGISGLLTLTGEVDELVLGGQEFWVQSICLGGLDGSVDGGGETTSTDSTGTEDGCYGDSFESYLAGTTWGAGSGQAPGAMADTSASGLAFSLQPFNHPTAGPVFNQASFIPAGNEIGNGQLLQLDNMAVRWDFTSDPIDELELVWQDQGTFTQLVINGAALVSGPDAGTLSNLPPTLGGVSIEAEGEDYGSYVGGQLHLSGAITTFEIGGQLIAIDDLCTSGSSNSDGGENEIEDEDEGDDHGWDSTYVSTYTEIEPFEGGCGAQVELHLEEANFGEAVITWSGLDSLGTVLFEEVTTLFNSDDEVEVYLTYVTGWTQLNVDIALDGTAWGNELIDVPYLDCPFAAQTPGCMDPEASNYDPLATLDDGSCRYPDQNFPQCDLTCDATLTMSSLTGAPWTAAPILPGDLLFDQNGITGTADILGPLTDTDGDGDVDFDDAPGVEYADVVGTPLAGWGSTKVLRTSNMAVVFDFTAALDSVGAVCVDVLDLGGIENFAVNGSPVYITSYDLDGDGFMDTPFYGGLETLNGMTINGVTIVASSMSVGFGSKTNLKLIGPVETLTLGGQEFWIDNICVQEAVPAAPAPVDNNCPADLNNDNSVTISDMLLMLAAFGVDC